MYYIHLGQNRVRENMQRLYGHNPFDIGADALQKADEYDIEKGRPSMPLGAKATWAGQDYLKTASGWKPVGKFRGHVKANHDILHANKDLDHHAMTHDAGSMSEEEWNKKHVPGLHGKYKAVHEYLNKQKQPKKEEVKEPEQPKEQQKEEPKPVEPVKEEVTEPAKPGDKIKAHTDEARAEALKDYLRSGMSSKEFFEKYDMEPNEYVNRYTTKNNKLKDTPTEIFSGDKNKEVEVTIKPLKVKQTSDTLEALAGAASKDDLRPMMMGVNFSNGFAVATDAHKMVITKTESQYHNQTINPATGKELKEGKYPPWRLVINQYEKAVKSVPIQGLMDQLNGLESANKIFQNKEAGVMGRLKIDDVDILVNPSTMLDALKAMVKTGSKKIHIAASAHMRGIVMTDETEQTAALVMPVYGGDADEMPYKTIFEGKQTPYKSQIVHDAVYNKDVRKIK
jgi:hypothetical protein